MIVATALPLIRSDAWWIRIFDFPRLQIMFVTAVAFVAYLFWGWQANLIENLFLFGLASAFAYQGYMMFPYTVAAAKQVQASTNQDAGSVFSLFFANVLMSNRNTEELRKIITDADPDIILAVETDEWWRTALKGLEETYEYTVLKPQDNTYGMLLYSRLELIDPEVKFLVQDDIPSIHTRVRLPSGVEVELRCLHPRPPFPTEDERRNVTSSCWLLERKRRSSIGRSLFWVI
jgi:endonuclease/exonuclease/phosphatase (EEP) superfamily protein YafD